MELFDALLASRFGSGFTPDEDQLAALNSGIDSSKVEQIGENAEQLGGLSFVKCTQEEYDDMPSHDPDTVYIIAEEEENGTQHS